MHKFPLSKIALLAFVLGATSSPAQADCRYTNELDARIETQGATALEVLATSGSLRIRGKAGATEVTARGEACTRHKDRLGEIEILTRRVDDRIQVIAAVPFENDREEWRIGELNLEVQVPDSLPLIVSDSSGDMTIRSVESLELIDSSGDAAIDDVRGAVLVVKDSSGDMRIRNAGDVTIRIDSSGDILVENAASVAIGEDTSGDIVVRDVSGDVSVGNDTSGSISASNVGGSFAVTNDSSGEIHARNIAGTTDIPR